MLDTSQQKTQIQGTGLGQKLWSCQVGTKQATKLRSWMIASCSKQTLSGNDFLSWRIVERNLSRGSLSSFCQGGFRRQKDKWSCELATSPLQVSARGCRYSRRMDPWQWLMVFILGHLLDMLAIHKLSLSLVFFTEVGGTHLFACKKHAYRHCETDPPSPWCSSVVVHPNERLFSHYWIPQESYNTIYAVGSQIGTPFSTSVSYSRSVGLGHCCISTNRIRSAH